MLACPRSLPPCILSLSLVLPASLGCGAHDDEGPATAAPAATMIPMGAPGAEGAKYDPAPAVPRPRPSDVRQKIDGTPADPLTPPSPFGLPPDNDHEGPAPPPPPNTKKKGTQI